MGTVCWRWDRQPSPGPKLYIFLPAITWTPSGYLHESGSSQAAALALLHILFPNQMPGTHSNEPDAK